MNNKSTVEILTGLTVSSLHTLKTHFNHMRSALDVCEGTLDSAIATDGQRLVEIGQIEAAYGNLMPNFRNVQTNQARLAQAISIEDRERNPLKHDIDKARITSLENAVNLVLALEKSGQLVLDPKAKEQLQLAVL